MDTGSFPSAARCSGGVYLDMQFIQRGRFLWQKSPRQVDEEVRAGLRARQALWQEVLHRR